MYTVQWIGFKKMKRCGHGYWYSTVLYGAKRYEREEQIPGKKRKEKLKIVVGNLQCGTVDRSITRQEDSQSIRSFEEITKERIVDCSWVWNLE